MAKNLKKVGRMEEAVVVEEENNFKLEKKNLSFSIESWKNGRRPAKNSNFMVKNLKKLEEWKKQ